MAASGGATVLVVDDEPLIRVMIKRWLSSAGFTVLEASSGRKAVAMLEDAAHAIALLVTDLAMPEMSGTELIAWALEARPDLPILCMTGHAEGVPAGVPVLDKPFRGPAFLDAVRDALAAGPARARIACG
jgi:CheY-like chemotaxis protein